MNLMKFLILALIASSAIAKDIQIKSGPNGPYCTPFDDPRCKSHFNREMERREEDRRTRDRQERYERYDRDKDFRR